MAQVLVAAGAAAVGIATGAAKGDQAGGQDGAFGVELFLAGLEEASDESGVFGYFHTFSSAIFSSGN